MLKLKYGTMAILHSIEYKSDTAEISTTIFRDEYNHNNKTKPFAAYVSGEASTLDCTDFTIQRNPPKVTIVSKKVKTELPKGDSFRIVKYLYIALCAVYKTMEEGICDVVGVDKYSPAGIWTTVKMDERKRINVCVWPTNRNKCFFIYDNYTKEFYLTGYTECQDINAKYLSKRIPKYTWGSCVKFYSRDAKITKRKFKLSCEGSDVKAYDVYGNIDDETRYQIHTDNRYKKGKKYLPIMIETLKKYMVKDAQDTLDEDSISSSEEEDIQVEIAAFLKDLDYPDDEYNIDIVEAICDWAGCGSVGDCVQGFYNKVQWEGTDYFFSSYTSAFDDWDYNQRETALEIAANWDRRELPAPKKGTNKTALKSAAQKELKVPKKARLKNKPGYCRKCDEKVELETQLIKAQLRYGPISYGITSTIRDELDVMIKSGSYTCEDCLF